MTNRKNTEVFERSAGAVTFLVLVLVLVSASYANESQRGGGLPMMGVPLSMFASGQEDEGDICPEGSSVVNAFISAWGREDYDEMLSLIDMPAEGYTREEMRSDLMVIEYKPYKISSVRQYGEDFEFLLSYGDWRDGDKDLKKVIINGRTFKIVLQGDNAVFKESLASYF